jgi:lysozyme family protein
MDAFERSFAITLGYEGGYSASDSDPGDWTGGAVGKGELRGTKFGISAAAYPGLDIAALTLAQAKAIYRRDYWDRVSGDALPPALALLAFDAAVNNGLSHATYWLQEAVGVRADGVIGPQTLAAIGQFVDAHGAASLCADFMARRLLFMVALPTWRSFSLGWARRLCSLPYQSLALV